MTTRRRATRAQTRHSLAACRKVLRTISRYLDNDLPGSVCTAIKRHLDQCRACARFVQTLKRTINLCRKADVARLTASAKQRLRREILTAISHA